jgi:hypothetical protein
VKQHVGEMEDGRPTAAEPLIAPKCDRCERAPDADAPVWRTSAPVIGGEECVNVQRRVDDRILEYGAAIVEDEAVGQRTGMRHDREGSDDGESSGELFAGG